MRPIWFLDFRFPAALLACVPAASFAQSRSNDNAVTQAEDAFGFSVGRESLGIYSSGSVRGFSPTAAGNLRIDGLYFDQASGLQHLLVDSVSIKVGLSAQGYPFTAPSGIVDQKLRTPSSSAGASVVANFDSYRTYGLEVDGSVPVTPKLGFAYGISGSRLDFYDGTFDKFFHSESLLARWHPSGAIEIMPFWGISNDVDDQTSTLFIPAGSFLPKVPAQHHNEGPDWAQIRLTTLNTGILASARLGQNWLLRLGAFRSVGDFKRNFTHLLDQEGADGSGEREVFVDPPTESSSNSGELRLTHSLQDGPRLHVIHLSVRERRTHDAFGGSDFIDLGPGRYNLKVVAPPPPEFHFGELSHDKVTQTTVGIAYDGRWKNVGEISFGISKAFFDKRTTIPGAPDAVTRSRPLLYNATIAGDLTRSIELYGGYSRGLEENGTAPPNAANRNQPLPTILTEQKDGGIRVAIGQGLKAVLGVFDLRKPYFDFDAENVFTQVGAISSQGVEFSLSGPITPRLDVVAGGVLLKSRVSADTSANAAIGRDPVGIPTHLLSLNANWRTPFVRGLAIDVALLHFGRTAATTSNAVFLPPRARVDVGSHYQFKLAGRNATFRIQLINLFNNRGLTILGSGVYTLNAGRNVQAYLAVDL